MTLSAILEKSMAPYLLIAALACIPMNANPHSDGYVIRNAREPIFVPCALPEPSPESANKILNDANIVLLVETIKDQALANPHRLIVLDPVQTTAEHRGAMTELLFEAIRRTKQSQPQIKLSIRGLPCEEASSPGSSGVDDPRTVLIHAVDVLFPGKSLILSDQINELQSLRRAAPKTFEAARGKPILFRTNRAWRIAFPRDAISDLADASSYAEDFPSLPQGNLLTMSIEVNTLPIPSDSAAATSTGQSSETGGSSPPGVGGGGGAGTGGGGSSSGGAGIPSAPSVPMQSGPAPFILTNNPFREGVAPLAAQIGAQSAIMIYQWTIDPHKTGTVNLTKLSTWIQENIPEDYSGFACLDIEHPYIQHLRLDPSHPNFQHAQEQILVALIRSKELRPHAKWSVYAIPTLIKWGRTEEKKTIAKAPASLLAALDWLAPSLYDAYPTSRGPSYQQNQREFIADILSLTREIAGDRPIIPFVWPRFHHNGSPTTAPAYQLIPDEEFLRDQLAPAMAHGANGLFWWDGDTYYLSTIARQSPPFPANHPNHDLQQYLMGLFSQEIPHGISDSVHMAAMQDHMLRLLAQAINKNP